MLLLATHFSFYLLLSVIVSLFLLKFLLFFIILIFWTKQKYVFDFQHYSFIAIIRKISLPSTQTGNSFVYAFHHCSGRMSCVLFLYIYFFLLIFSLWLANFRFDFQNFIELLSHFQNIRTYCININHMEGGIVLRFSTIHVCFNVIELEISLYAFILALFLYILNYLYFVFELLFAMFPSPFFWKFAFKYIPINLHAKFFCFYKHFFCKLSSLFAFVLKVILYFFSF